ncbi:MAG: hypothetical protein ACJAUC_001399, partial [Planctomycetota bacterium]
LQAGRVGLEQRDRPWDGGEARAPSRADLALVDAQPSPRIGHGSAGPVPPPSAEILAQVDANQASLKLVHCGVRLPQKAPLSATSMKKRPRLAIPSLRTDSFCSQHYERIKDAD